MKEDYLWDKTGSDESIEKLENALRIFSHDKEAAFAVPVAAAAEKWSFFKGLKPLVFAAACLAIAAIAWGGWMQLSTVAPVEDQAFVAAPPIEDQQTPTNNLIALPSDPVGPAVAPAPTIVRTVHRPLRNKRGGGRTVLHTPPAEAPKPEFTKEEIYAYDQLVLALSITSDKLGQVREKAIGENK
jgi:hypothetical protein